MFFFSDFLRSHEVLSAALEHVALRSAHKLLVKAGRNYSIYIISMPKIVRETRVQCEVKPYNVLEDMKHS